MTDFILGGFKIPADGDCNHEIKRRLLRGRKVVINPDSILKRRDILFIYLLKSRAKKVCLVKAMVFLVVMYGVRVELYRKLSAEELML